MSCRAVGAASVLLILTSSPVLAEPPFSGTVWVNSNILDSSDASSLRSVTYEGRGEREFFDPRTSRWVDVNAYLFGLQYNGRLVECQVHPDSGDLDSVQELVDDYALVLGRMPRVLLSRVKEFEIMDGADYAGGNGYLGIIHRGRPMDQWVEREGWLEEVLFHEGVHVSLDGDYLASPGWIAAREADGEFISDYARDFPDREDLAETALMWFALRYRPDRLSASQRAAIREAIPNRLAYLDGLALDWSPYIARPWSLSDGVKDLVDEALNELNEDSNGRQSAESVPALPAAGVLLLAILLGVRGRRLVRAG